MKAKLIVNGKEIECDIEQSQIDELCKPKFKYPLFKKSKYEGFILKFTALNVAEVVFQTDSYYSMGYNNNNWTNHTDEDVWEDVSYDEERGLWDGQPVECWDVNKSHKRDYRFYDLIHKCTYDFSGKRFGLNYDYIEPISYNKIPDWMFEAYKTLEK